MEDSEKDAGLVISLRANTPEKVEAERRANAAVAAFIQNKSPGPVPRSVWMGDGYCEVFVFNRRVHLSAVFVLPDARKKGLGTQYLQELLSASDRYGSEVQCSIEAFGDNSDGSRLTNRQLISWYKRHGFKEVPERKKFLVRPASKAL